jgi:hypothetical protein
MAFFIVTCFSPELSLEKLSYFQLLLKYIR